MRGNSSTALLVMAFILGVSLFFNTPEDRLGEVASALVLVGLVLTGLVLAVLEELVCEIKGLRADWVDDEPEEESIFNIGGPWPDTGMRVEDFEVKQ